MSTVKSLSKAVSTYTVLTRLTASLLRWSAILLSVSFLFLTLRRCSLFLFFSISRKIFTNTFSWLLWTFCRCFFLKFAIFSLSSCDFQYQSLYHFFFFLISFSSFPYQIWPSSTTVFIINRGRLCGNCKPRFLPLLIFNWRTFLVIDFPYVWK